LSPPTTENKIFYLSINLTSSDWCECTFNKHETTGLQSTLIAAVGKKIASWNWVT